MTITTRGVSPAPTPPPKGVKGSRIPVDLFGATDEAAETIQGEGLGWLLGPSLLRQSLRGAAGRLIFCPVTGEILDASTVVTCSLVVDGKVEHVSVTSPQGWAERGAGFVHAAQAVGITVKVLTERHIRAAIRAEKTEGS